MTTPPSEREAAAPVASVAPFSGPRLFRWWRAPRSAQTVVVVLSLWLVPVANIALWNALAGIERGPRLAGIVAAVLPMLLGATAGLLALTAWSRWMKPVWIAVLIAAGVCQHYMLSFGSVIDTTMLASVFATNPGEARDLLTWTLLGHILLVAALPTLWLLQVPVLRMGAGRTLLRTALLFAAAALLCVTGVTGAYRVLAPLVRNHMDLRYLPNPVVPIWSLARLVAKPLRGRPPPLVPISEGAALGPSHAAGTKPPLLVLVVGETARSDHFALNGYARDTTPELATRGVLSHRNAWSCGTNTLASVPCMFSSLGKVAFEKRSAEHENLLDVVQAAGLAVIWIDNQAGCKDVCARVPSASTTDLADTPAGKRLCAEGECLDEALLENLDARIAALPAERRAKGVLVVMHQMGSHGPAYGRRSTPAYKRFAPECATTTLGDCEPQSLINVYDNSIAYTDHVLARTIDWLQGQQAAYDPALLYVSDHGESLGEFGVFLHGLPYAIAPDTQKHVPWITWLGDGFAASRKLDRACLRGRLDEKISHDNLFPSVLSLLDVTSPAYKPELDLWRTCR